MCLHSHRFVPPANEDDIMWSIPPPSLDVCAKRLSSHAFEPLPSLARVLAGIRSDTTIHTLPSTVLFPALPPSLSQAQAARSEDALLPALHQARLLKTEHEVALMARANAITSQAHEVVMRALGRHAAGRGVAAQGPRSEERGVGAQAAEWEIEGEGDAEALFVAACRRGGCVRELHIREGHCL
jgi:Xaa-Pro dipeptidase